MRVFTESFGKYQLRLDKEVERVLTTTGWTEGRSEIQVTSKEIAVRYLCESFPIIKDNNTYSSQLLCGDGAVTILVEQGKCFLELGDLLLCQLIGLKV